MKLRWRYRPKGYNLSKYGHIIRMKNAEIERLKAELEDIKTINWKLVKSISNRKTDFSFYEGLGVYGE